MNGPLKLKVIVWLTILSASDSLTTKIRVTSSLRFGFLYFGCREYFLAVNRIKIYIIYSVKRDTCSILHTVILSQISKAF